MAVLNQQQVDQRWIEGNCERFALFAVKNVTSGDTVDLGTYFRTIMQTFWMGATVSGVAAGTFTGTVATAPAGLTNAGAFLLVQGVAF
jgi:predicted RecA/RadA family phage recombinase